ncbi:MAG: tRNA lysidine(34) synthetase TilS [Motiliproteus sp.]
MIFSAAVLIDRLAQVAVGNTTGVIWIAYSGGMDSRVLLQLALEAGLNAEGRLKAVHIHHGLHPLADDWALHCQSTAEGLGVALAVHRISIEPGSSLENQARIGRYRVFESLLGDADLLLQGHHADDQAETLLLRLMRGSGVRGLASIPKTRPLGRGRLIRPLLDCTRRQLECYAVERQLRWVDDPSNQDMLHDRNYLRASVLPLLKQRWSAAVPLLALSARNSADAQRLCEELAAIDLQRCQQQDAGLSVDSLAQLSNHRRANLLRHWLQTRAGVLPDAALLRRLWAEVANARIDAQPQMQLRAMWLRRFEGGLYLLPEPLQIDSKQVWDWLLVPGGISELQLPGGRLRAEPRIGAGLALPDSGVLQIRLRQGGERIQLSGRAGSRSLKKLLQQSRIAPWQREQLPLIYAGAQLLAVADLWLAEGCLAAPEQVGLALSWTPLPAAVVPLNDGDF